VKDSDYIPLPEAAKILNQLLNSCNRNRENVTVSIESEWGNGKTRFLEEWQDGINHGQTPFLFQILFVNYNAWTNNQIEDPLIPILLSIFQSIISPKKNFDDSVKKAGIAIGKVILTIAKSAPQTSFIANGVESVIQALTVKQESSLTSTSFYSSVLSYQQAIEEAQTELKNIRSSGIQIVLMVDDVDRCLPSLQINLLERIHHLAAEDVGLFSVVAICPSQLVSAINSYYGSEKDTDDYLKKIFQNRISLSNKPAKIEASSLLAAFFSHSFNGGLIDASGNVVLTKDLTAEILEELIIKGCVSMRDLFNWSDILESLERSNCEKGNTLESLTVLFLSLCKVKSKKIFDEILVEKTFQINSVELPVSEEQFKLGLSRVADYCSNFRIKRENGSIDTEATLLKYIEDFSKPMNFDDSGNLVNEEGGRINYLAMARYLVEASVSRE